MFFQIRMPDLNPAFLLTTIVLLMNQIEICINVVNSASFAGDEVLYKSASFRIR